MKINNILIHIEIDNLRSWCHPPPTPTHTALCIRKLTKWSKCCIMCKLYICCSNFLQLLLFLYFQKRLEGYQFPVYLTSFCPKDEIEWNKRSSAINCTSSNGYLCLPNENFTKLLEFCYTEPKIWILKGKSFILNFRNVWRCLNANYLFAEK